MSLDGLGVALGEALAHLGDGPVRTRAETLELFKEATRRVWRNPDFLIPALFMAEEEPEGGFLASVSYVGSPRAIGNSVFTRPPRYTLRVSEAFLALSDGDALKALIHEAGHLGYRGHGEDFRKVVRAAGGVVSGAAIERDVIEVQQKVGARYRTVKEFPGGEEREAVAWAKEQLRLNPGTKWRIQQ